MKLIKRNRNIKRIHVNGARLREYTKHGTVQPVVILKDKDGSTYATAIDVLDAKGHVIATIKQSLEKPMPGCGARVWVETTHDVVLHEPETFEGCPI